MLTEGNQYAPQYSTEHVPQNPCVIFRRLSGFVLLSFPLISPVLVPAGPVANSDGFTREDVLVAETAGEAGVCAAHTASPP